MSRTRNRRDPYRHFVTFATRWRDNDVYAHMNNAVYYEYVDTLVNGWLIASGGLEVPGGPVVCVVAETGCVFHAALGFPDPLEAGLRLERLGRTSITYGIGLFRPGAIEESATARFVHVCVARDSRQPVEVPETLRLALAALA
jgi:acyl-CoA thioester hydrolase